MLRFTRDGFTVEWNGSATFNVYRNGEPINAHTFYGSGLNAGVSTYECPELEARAYAKRLLREYAEGVEVA